MQRNPIIARLVPSVLIASLAASLAGCGGPVSQSNYDKVTTGMTQDQVEAILGKGTEKASTGMAIPGMAGKILQWTDGNKSIIVTFAMGKVVTKTESGL